MAKKTKDKNEIVNRVETALATVEKIEKGFDSGQQPQIPASIASIKILRESQQYEFPGEAIQNSFVANILFNHRVNNLFLGPFDQDKAAECSSLDGVWPTSGSDPRPGPCGSCPLNEWGSAEVGCGKACGNYLNIFVMLKDEETPYLLRCPPTSLGKKSPLMIFLTYSQSLAKKQTGVRAYQLLNVEFSLNKQTYASGTSSVVVPKMIDSLNPEKDTERIDLLMYWYKRIETEWQSAITAAGEKRKDIQAANKQLEAEREDVEAVGVVTNPDFSENPEVPTDEIPF